METLREEQNVNYIELSEERRLTKKDMFNYFEGEHPHYTLYLMDV